MTPRKPKPRKTSKAPTLAERLSIVETAREFDGEWLEEINKRLDALEARKDLRDKSHDDPVSNAAEAVGQYEGLRYRIVGEVRPSALRRFLRFMGSP